MLLLKVKPVIYVMVTILMLFMKLFKTLKSDHYKSLGLNALEFSKILVGDKIIKKYIELI